MAVSTSDEGAAVTGAPEFEAFYRRERAALYRALALTLGEAELARDAVDEAMVRAYQRWRRVRAYDNPAGWVYRVALNWGISAVRRRRRLARVAAIVDRAGTGEPALPDEQLAGALAGLPEQQRAVVVLRFHLDWSTQQVAAALGLPTGTVKSRLHRGLATLRRQLEAGE